MFTVKILAYNFCEKIQKQIFNVNMRKRKRNKTWMNNSNEVEPQSTIQQLIVHMYTKSHYDIINLEKTEK